MPSLRWICPKQRTRRSFEQVVGRPRRDPYLAAQRVHRLDRRHEIVVARDQHGRVEGADGRVVDHLRDEPRVHSFSVVYSYSALHAGQRPERRTRSSRLTK